MLQSNLMCFVIGRTRQRAKAKTTCDRESRRLCLIINFLLIHLALALIALQLSYFDSRCVLKPTPNNIFITARNWQCVLLSDDL